MRLDRPRARARETFHDERLADEGFGDDEIVDIEAMIVFGIGNRALQRLLDVEGDALARKFEISQRPFDLLAAMSWARRFSFCGLMRSMRATALAS